MTGIVRDEIRRVGLPQLIWGGLLIAVFWPLNWVLPGLRTAFLFFPLWLGYALLVDGLVAWRSGTSRLTRSKREFVLLFVISSPAWWLFEVINWRTRNWEYLGAENFTGLQYILLCTVSFSTVMPAVFGTADFIRTFSWVDRFKARARIEPTPRLMRGMFLAGWIMLALVLAWPRYFYPLVWGAVFMILEPVNVWRSRPSFFRFLAAGDWRPVAALSAGAVVCGWFWEMWNFYSYPKWIYHTPGAEYLYVFEMPLLGYLGYLPFAGELMALRNSVWPGRD